MSIKGVFQARCCSQFRQWWACCPCSRRTSGGRCSCTGPGRCEPSGHWPQNQTCPGVSCCSRAAVDARSLPPAGAGSWPLWSANGRGDNKQHLQRFIFLCLGKVSGIWIPNFDWHIMTGLVSPAQWSVCSWRCSDHAAPHQNTESLPGREQETAPPGTAAELEHTK